MTDEPVETFFSAWGMADPDTRRAAIAAAFAPGARYADPMTEAPLEGAEAVAAYVDKFTEMAPGATAEVVDRQDRHGTTRATVAFRMADGMVQHGQYFVEYDGERIARMVGFVGTGAPA